MPFQALFAFSGSVHLLFPIVERTSPLNRDHLDYSEGYQIHIELADCTPDMALTAQTR
jgi:hypothetical protein